MSRDQHTEQSASEQWVVNVLAEFEDGTTGEVTVKHPTDIDVDEAVGVALRAAAAVGLSQSFKCLRIMVEG